MTDKTFDGPIYSAQTHEPEHLEGEGRIAWVRARTYEAKAAGCVDCRYTIAANDTGLLVEGWTTHAPERPAPRWHVAA